MMKLLIAANNLAGGGAEKVLLTLINALPQNQYEIDLLLVKNKGIYLNQIPKHIRLITMIDVTKGDSPFPAEVSVLRRYCAEMLSSAYDVEIAFLEGPPTKLLACHTTVKARKIAWVHTDLKNLHWTAPYYTSNEEERAVYEQFDDIVFVSEGSKQGFLQRFGGLSVSSHIITNPTAYSEIQAKAQLFSVPHDSFCFCAVASLSARKGQSRILHAMGRLFHEGFCFQLNLVGTGDNLSFLTELAHVLEIYDYVNFYGFQNNPYPYMANCDVVISSSISEGFPLVLCEALALQKPIVATRCAGNSDVLQGGRFGLLVENTEDGLYQGMKLVMTDPDFYMELIQKSCAGVKSLQYDTIIAQVQNLLREREGLQ